MTVTDIFIAALLLVVVGVAVYYIRKEKKQGHCVGCPYARECVAKRTGQSCSDQNKQ